MDFLQPPDPPEDGNCLRCGAFVTRDEQRAGICIDCQPAEDGEQPAFPVQASDYGGHGTCFGMSLRDYFAAKALATASAFPSNDVQHWDASDFATHAYAIADAMLAARNA